jgi:hypothetical protein
VTPDTIAFVSAVAAAVSAVFAGLSAAFAGWQIWLSRRDTQRRAAFDQIRAVSLRLDAYMAVASKHHPALVMRVYSQEADVVLNDGARAYMALLVELDLAAYGIERKLLDRKTALDYLQTILRREVVSRTFVRDLAKACGDPCTLEHLDRALAAVHRERDVPLASPAFATSGSASDAN